MQNNDNLKIYNGHNTNESADMDRRKLAVSVLRNLESDLKLTNQLENLTAQVNSLVRCKSLEKMTNEEFDELNSIGNQIDEIAEIMRNGRKVLERMLLDSTGNQATLREFIKLSPQPLRQQLDDLRNRLLNKSHNIRAQLTSGQTVVFYSVNAYRKQLEGLMEFSGSSGQYQAKGEAPKFPTGRLLRKTC